MFTEEFKKACEGCQSEEELKAVIDLHKSELTDEELRQISGGVVLFSFMGNDKNPFDLKRKGGNFYGNSLAKKAEKNECVPV